MSKYQNRSIYNSRFIENKLDILLKDRNVHCFSNAFFHNYFISGITGVSELIQEDLVVKQFLFFPILVRKDHWNLIAVNMDKEEIYHYNSCGYNYKWPVKVVIDFLNDLGIIQSQEMAVFENVNYPTLPHKNSGPWILQVAKDLIFNFSGADMEYSLREMDLIKEPTEEPTIKTNKRSRKEKQMPNKKEKLSHRLVIELSV